MRKSAPTPRSSRTGKRSVRSHAPASRWSQVSLSGGSSARPSNALDVALRSKHGVAILEFKRVQSESDFSESEWASFLDITVRSLQRLKQSGRTLDTSASERVLLIRQLLERGREVFEEVEAFDQWLRLPNWFLGGETPISLLDTATGIQLVLDEIGKIEHGVI